MMNFDLHWCLYKNITIYNQHYINILKVDYLEIIKMFFVNFSFYMEVLCLPPKICFNLTNIWVVIIQAH